MQSRRNFLRGRLRDPVAVRMRPPGATAEFAHLCTSCGDCARACPVGIIVRHETGEPTVSFSNGACTFCLDCVRACETGALSQSAAPVWPWRAVIRQNCLSVNGVACRACEDVCDPAAIRFRPMTGGRAAPVLDPEQCTGCGACAFACPADAVAFELAQPAPEAAP